MLYWSTSYTFTCNIRTTTQFNMDIKNLIGTQSIIWCANLISTQSNHIQEKALNRKARYRKLFLNIPPPLSSSIWTPLRLRRWIYLQLHVSYICLLIFSYKTIWNKIKITLFRIITLWAWISIHNFKYQNWHVSDILRQ